MLMKKGRLTVTQENQQEEQPKPKDKKISKRDKAGLKKAKKNRQDHPVKTILDESEHSQRIIDENQPMKEEELSTQKIEHLAICFPDSILEVPQTSALRAYFISQIARIASIFKVDQIVILKDHGYTQKSQKFVPCDYIARNLQYLETPQYLRKYLFKMHPDLNNVGLMNPVQSLHHLRSEEKCQFREGVALERPTKPGTGSWVDIGLKQQAKMNHLVLPLTRVTLRIKNYQDENANMYEAEAVSKSTPRQEKGFYWGYDVRIAQNMKEVMKGYDVVMLSNHSRQSHGLEQIQNFSVLGGQKVMIYFAGTENIDKQIARDPNPKYSFEKAWQKIDYAIKLSESGVKQLRLQERMMLTLSKFTAMTK